MRSLCLLMGSFLMFLTEGDAQLRYHCQRPPGPSCSGNGICQADGSCLCNPPTEWGGLDCGTSIVAPATLTGVCSPPCQNGGLCYRATGNAVDGERCLCTGGFAGTDCSLSRAQIVQCLPGMVVDIFPQTPSSSFVGSVTVQERGTTSLVTGPGCSFSRPTNFNDEHFQISFSTIVSTNPNISPCNAGLQERIDPVTNEKTFCYEIRVRYSPQGILSRFDEVLTFCCDEQANPDTNSVNVGSISSVGGVNINAGVSVVTSRLSLTSDISVPIPLGTTISVGTELTVVLGIANSADRYTDLVVKDCTARSQSLVIQLLSDGCPTGDAFAIVRGVDKDTPREVHVNIWAFKPSASGASVEITCTVDVCETACPVRTPTTCPGTSIPNLGRRRRAVEDVNNTTQTFNTTASYSIYIEVPKATSESCDTCDACAMTKEMFLPVAVVFGLVQLAVLFLAIFMCFRYSKTRNTKASA